GGVRLGESGLNRPWQRTNPQSEIQNSKAAIPSNPRMPNPMSAIPTHLARVPNFLASQIMLGSIQGTNQRLLQTQIELSSGKAINRPSDDPVAANTIGVLDNALERREQRLRNLTHGESVLNNQ